MGTIKGQNLRVMVGTPSRCVAAAKSCTVHIALQFEDTSTKDSTDDWAENEPVGKDWDGSVEALITDGLYDAQKVVADTVVSGSGGDAYQSMKGLVLQPGQTFFVRGDATVFVMGESSPLTAPATEVASYTNEGSAAINVFAACDTEDEELQIYITDAERATCSELLTAFFAGNKVKIRFSVTGGRNNIVESDALLEGMAILNDLQLTAQNRASGQFTMQFTGSGELARVEEEEE